MILDVHDKCEQLQAKYDEIMPIWESKYPEQARQHKLQEDERAERTRLKRAESRKRKREAKASPGGGGGGEDEEEEDEEAVKKATPKKPSLKPFPVKAAEERETPPSGGIVQQLLDKLEKIERDRAVLNTLFHNVDVATKKELEVIKTALKDVRRG